MSGAAVLSFRQYLKFLNENCENRSPLINASRPPSAILSIANEVPPPSLYSTQYDNILYNQYHYLMHAKKVIFSAIRISLAQGGFRDLLR